MGLFDAECCPDIALTVIIQFHAPTLPVEDISLCIAQNKRYLGPCPASAAYATQHIHIGLLVRYAGRGHIQSAGAVFVQCNMCRWGHNQFHIAIQSPVDIEVSS